VNRCLAEGRKSFLERYAGIESGRECERLAPALSAFVDGEADGAQAVALRMHLRQCLACRAAVRGLHDASRPLAVVFPAGLAVAAGGAEQTHSFFVRVYETVSMHMHERTANSLLRAQAVVDTVTAGKMAAAAASAAALAGGGVAVEGVLTASPATPQALVRRADNGASATFVKQPSLKTTTHAKHRSHARAPSRRRATASSTHRSTPVATTAQAAAPKAAATSSSRIASQPQPTTPRASAAAAGANSSASGEFGFEGP
jgi:hypothetical protein